MLHRSILFIVNLNVKFFGSVGATCNGSTKEAPTELGYEFLNKCYKQDALTEQKKKKCFQTIGPRATLRFTATRCWSGDQQRRRYDNLGCTHFYPWYPFTQTCLLYGKPFKMFCANCFNLSSVSYKQKHTI